MIKVPNPTHVPKMTNFVYPNPTLMGGKDHNIPLLTPWINKLKINMYLYFRIYQTQYTRTKLVPTHLVGDKKGPKSNIERLSMYPSP
jgi:hypothetical protein